jgi:hypothetical protein
MSLSVNLLFTVRSSRVRANALPVLLLLPPWLPSLQSSLLHTVLLLAPSLVPCLRCNAPPSQVARAPRDGRRKTTSVTERAERACLRSDPSGCVRWWRSIVLRWMREGSKVYSSFIPHRMPIQLYYKRFHIKIIDVFHTKALLLVPCIFLCTPWFNYKFST